LRLGFELGLRQLLDERRPAQPGMSRPDLEALLRELIVEGAHASTMALPENPCRRLGKPVRMSGFF